MASERKIGSTVYRCEMAPADQGIALYLDLNDTFAGDLSVLAAVADRNVSRKAVLSIFMMTSVSSTLDKDKVQEFVKRCVEMCTTGGDPCIIGVKPQTMSDAIEVAFFALQTNLLDFLVESLPAPQAENPLKAA